MIVSEESSDTTETEVDAEDEEVEVNVEDDVDEDVQEEAKDKGKADESEDGWQGKGIRNALKLLIDGDGNLTIPNKVMPIDDYGRFYDKQGHPLDAEGYPLDKNGERIDGSKPQTPVELATTLYDNLFKGVNEVKSIDFVQDSNVTIVGADTFRACVNLVSVDFSKCRNLGEIATSAFEGCVKLVSVTFNNKIDTLGANAFKDCVELPAIEFSENMIEVGAQAFYGCTKLTSVSLHNVPKFNANGNTFKGCSISNIQFNEVSVVPKYMFDHATFDENATIVIPHHITTIQEGAFAEAAKLVHIRIEDEENAKSLMTSIGKKAFYKCADLQPFFDKWPSKMQAIEEETFSGCNAFVNVEIPETVHSIGTKAFAECKGLEMVKLAPYTNEDNALGERIFYNCSFLETVVVPDDLKQIGVYEFEMCSALSDIELPVGLEKIGKGAFKNCDSLVTINIPSKISVIEDETFALCDRLTTADMPDIVTRIGNQAFYECGKYKLVGSDADSCGSLPRDLEVIGSKAFSNNDAFTGVLEIPAKVTEIHQGAFFACELVTGIRFKGFNDIKCDPNPTSGIFERHRSVTFVEFPEPNGSNVYKKIPAWLFARCKLGVDEIIIPETVTEIGEGAFAGQYGDSNAYGVNIPKITFANRTTNDSITIGKYAFRYCSAIKDFILPEKDINGRIIPYYIREGAFCYCTNLLKFQIPEGTKIIGKEAFKECGVLGEIRYNAIELQDSGTKKEKKEYKDFTDHNRFLNCAIKNIYFGENVKTFPDYLFEGGKFTYADDGVEKLIDITIPASTERIGSFALPNVVNLGRLIISEGSQLKEIGAYAFHECLNLSAIVGNLPDSIVDIENNAFTGCVMLGLNDEEFHIPTGLTHLGSGAFEGCKKIRKVVIPAGVTSINSNTFKGDEYLTSAVIEGAVENIDNSAFEGCRLLKVLRIPNGVKSVGTNAFAGCVGLEKAYVPQSVTTIGNGAFTVSANIIYYVSKGSDVESWLNDNIPKTTPKASVHTYKYRVDYVLKKGKNAPYNTYGFDSDNEKDNDQDAYDLTLADGIGINGSSFVGWYLDPEYTKKVELVKAEQAEGALITIYSNWITLQYPIEYVLRGGVNDPENPLSYDMFADPIKLKNPTYPVPEGSKMKVTFQGWFEDLEDKTTQVKEIKGEDMRPYILYAKWSNESAKPTASIASGSKVVKGTKLKLYSAGAIYYTEDGTIPSSDDTSGRTKTYSGGITINSKIKIRAIALESGKTDSLPATFEYSLLEESEYWGDVDEEDQQEKKTPDKVPAGIWVAGVPEWVPYTGEAVVFDDVRVYDHKTRLIEGVDYTVKYKNNKKAAESSDTKAPSVIIKGKGSYNGSYTHTFSIRVVTPVTSNPGATAIKKATITYNPAVVYDWGSLSANAIGLKLTFGGKNLEEGKDYICAFSKKKVGKATVTVIGINNFKGKAKKKFNITPADISKTVNTKVYPLDEAGNEISENKATGTVAYQKGGVQPKVSVYYKGKRLVEGVHYKLTYSGNEKVGTAKVTAEGKGNFANKAAAVSYKVMAGNVAELNIGVSGIKASTKFAAIKKGTLTVLDVNGKLLSFSSDAKQTDYEVKWVYLDGNEQEIEIDGKTKGMVTAGTKIRVYITGKNNYTGTRMIESKVYTATIAKAKVKIPAQQFTGRAVEPDANTIAVSVKGNSLIVDKDFTIVGYGPNVKAGSVKVYLVGKEGYGGLKTGKFKITKKKMIQN
ncbi:MAG: leucine-rich repeat protein [Lachnospiraceae bacterium]|nr:leucine-rich repeat protein [Lachnospiraceae bacterium]